MNLRRISFLLLTGTIAIWALAGLPVARAANTTDAKPAGSHVDLRQQEKELRNTLSAHPSDAAAHLKLGQVYIDEGRYAAAEEEARAARLGGDQYHDGADALLAWSLFLEDQNDRLLREIKPGNREPRAESTVRLSLGLAQFKISSFDSAESLLRDAVRLDPSSWRAHIALASLLIVKRKLPEAHEQLDAARAIEPDKVGVIRITGELDRAEGDTTQAIAAFTEVIKLHPTSIPALAGRADALISLNKLAEAQKDVGAALKLVANNQVIFLGGLIAAREGDFAKAGRSLERASPVATHMPIGYYLYGVVKFQLGLPESADNYLARFQAKQPNVSGAARVRAAMALRRKDPASAIALLRPVIEANPADQAAATMLARAYLSNAQPEQVIQLYEKLTTAPPHQGAAAPDIGGLVMIYGDAEGDLAEVEKVIMQKAPDVVAPMTALRQGDVAKAAQMAEALSTSKPDDPWVQNVLGSVRLAQKRLSEAEGIFRHILDKQPDFAAAHFNLVEVLVAQKRLDEARAMLRDLAGRKLDDSTI